MANEHTVYALFDPREPDRTRYVGVTGDIVRRYREHAEKHDKGRGRKSAWRASLSADGVVLGMRVIVSCVDRLPARIAEWESVKKLRRLGQCDLNDPIPAPLEYDPPADLTQGDLWNERRVA